MQAGVGFLHFRKIRVPGRILFPGCGIGGFRLHDVDQFDLEDEIVACLDDRTAILLAIGQSVRNVEQEDIAFVHLLQALRPAGDDLVEAEHGGGTAIIGGVEFLTVGRAAFIIHAHQICRRGCGVSIALVQHNILQAAIAFLDICIVCVPGQVFLEGCVYICRGLVSAAGGEHGDGSKGCSEDPDHSRLRLV